MKRRSFRRTAFSIPLQVPTTGWTSSSTAPARESCSRPLIYKSTCLCPSVSRPSLSGGSTPSRTLASSQITDTRVSYFPPRLLGRYFGLSRLRLLSEAARDAGSEGNFPGSLLDHARPSPRRSCRFLRFPMRFVLP